MSRSVIYTANTTSQTVAAGGTISLGSTIRRQGCGAVQSGETIALTGPGYYRVSVSATVIPTAASTVGIQIMDNGNAVTGGSAGAETTAGLQDILLAAQAVVRVNCACIGGAISVQLTGAECTITNLAVIIEKM